MLERCEFIVMMSNHPSKIYEYSHLFHAKTIKNIDGGNRYIKWSIQQETWYIHVLGVL